MKWQKTRDSKGYISYTPFGHVLIHDSLKASFFCNKHFILEFPQVWCWEIKEYKTLDAAKRKAKQLLKARANCLISMLDR